MIPPIAKNDLRKHYTALRRGLSLTEKKAADLVIAKFLLDRQQIRGAQTICTYVSLPEEVDTHELIRRLLDLGKTIVVPRVTDDRLALLQIQSFADLVSGNFSILEPNGSCPLVDKSTIDVFIVPGVAFDRAGYRLGWGKGHYDRLLAGVKAPKIGLAYGRQVVTGLPHSSYDIPMSAIISEKETVERV